MTNKDLIITQKFIGIFDERLEFVNEICGTSFAMCLYYLKNLMLYNDYENGDISSENAEFYPLHHACYYIITNMIPVTNMELPSELPEDYRLVYDITNYSVIDRALLDNIQPEDVIIFEAEIDYSRTKRPELFEELDLVQPIRWFNFEKLDDVKAKNNLIKLTSNLKK